MIFFGSFSGRGTVWLLHFHFPHILPTHKLILEIPTITRFWTLIQNIDWSWTIVIFKFSEEGPFTGK